MARSEGAVAVARRGNDDEGGVALADGPADVGAGRQPVAAFFQQVGQARFEDRCLPLVEELDHSLVKIGTPDLMPPGGEASCQGRAEFTQSDDRNVHAHLLSCVPPTPGCQEGPMWVSGNSSSAR